MSKKKDKLNLTWLKERIADKKSYWRKYRENEDDLDLDDNDKFEIIAKLMTKILIRKPKYERSEDEFADPQDPKLHENATMIKIIKPPALTFMNWSLKFVTTVNDKRRSVEKHSQSELDKYVMKDHGEND